MLAGRTAALDGGDRAGGPRPPGVGADRRCRARCLDNPVRRWLAPAATEVGLLGIFPGSTVADLGAGVAYHGREILAQMGPRGALWLVEIDPTALGRVRARLGPDPRIHLVEGSVSRIRELADRSIDRALLSLVLCCVSDKEGTMEEAWRILRPGGRLLVTYPRFPFRLRVRAGGGPVTRAAWATLRGRRPWKEWDLPQGRLVQRHLLERPDAGAIPGSEETSGAVYQPDGEPRFWSSSHARRGAK